MPSGKRLSTDDTCRQSKGTFLKLSSNVLSFSVNLQCFHGVIYLQKAFKSIIWPSKVYAIIESAYIPNECQQPQSSKSLF